MYDKHENMMCKIDERMKGHMSRYIIFVLHASKQNVILFFGFGFWTIGSPSVVVCWPDSAPMHCLHLHNDIRARRLGSCLYDTERNYAQIQNVETGDKRDSRK